MTSKQRAVAMIERAHRRMIGATYFYELATAAEGMTRVSQDRKRSEHIQNADL